MVAIESFKNNKGQVVASVKNQLKDGFLYCEWQSPYITKTPFYTEPECQLSYIPKQEFDYCLNDLSAMQDVEECHHADIILGFSQRLESFDFQKLILIGHAANNKLHQKIYNVIIEKGISVEVLRTASQAVQCLLVPGHDESIWDDVPTIRY